MSANLLFISGMPGPGEMVIILIIVLILFGGRKIPQLAKDLGSGIREFRKSLSGTTDVASTPELEERYEEEKSAPRKKSSKRSKQS